MELDWVTSTIEIVNFLVLVWILQRFLYKPIMRTIARRKAAIDQTLADARERQSGAETLERTYRDRLTAWEQEKAGLRTRALAEIEAERTRALAALEQTLAQERERRRVIEERETRDARTRLAQDAAAQGAQFAGRLLARLADAGLEKRLVAMALEDIGRLPDGAVQTLRDACRGAGNKIGVTSAFALPAAERGALQQALGRLIGADFEAHFTEDAHLLAGLRVSVGAWILRANLRDELRFFAESANRVA